MFCNIISLSHMKNFTLVQFTGHRHLPLHIHHPLSKRLPSESRGKKSGRKRRCGGRRRGSASSGGAPTIEEDEQEEEVEEDQCSPQDGDGNATTPTPDNDPDAQAEPVQVHALSHKLAQLQLWSGLSVTLSLCFLHSSLCVMRTPMALLLSKITWAFQLDCCLSSPSQPYTRATVAQRTPLQPSE